MKVENSPNLLPIDGEARYFATFFSKYESDLLFEDLQKAISWTQEPILLFGKRILQPRLTAWYGDPESEYGYSGIRMIPLPWTPSLLKIKTKVDQFVDMKFNGALLNQYRNGLDSMGWHRDDEKELGVNPVVASISFGAHRPFRLRHIRDKNLNCQINLEHGSLLLMRGTTQHHWEHCLAKSKKVLGPRINITFRTIKAR